MGRYPALETHWIMLATSSLILSMMGAGVTPADFISASREAGLNLEKRLTKHQALEMSGLDKEQLDCVAVVAGPGSFTGVRIGVCLAKGIAHAAGLPCARINALDALAYRFIRSQGLICPVLDARRDQVYAAAFDGMTGQRLMEDEPIVLSDFIARAAEIAGERKLLLTGDGMLAYREQLERMGNGKLLFADAAHAYLRPASAAVLAAERISDAVSADDLKPCYLRAPQAVRQRNLVEKAQHE